MAKIWKTLKSRRVHKNRYFSVYDDDVIKPDGSRGKYFILRKGAGVVIIPFDGRKIWMVNQYRYTFKKRLWELPAGKSESKNYLAQAKKELKEETGFTAGSWKYLGEFACAPGHSGHIGKAYLATKLIPGPHEREGGEADMRMTGFTLSAIDKMIAGGKIIDSWATTPLYLLKLYLQKKK